MFTIPTYFRSFLLFSVMIFAAAPLAAKDRIGLFNELSLVNDAPWMASANLHVNGWADAGIVYNANDPRDNYNGPVVFVDRANEFNLHQLGLQLFRDIDTKGGTWDIGGKVTVMYGTDARFNTINPYGDKTWDNNLIGASQRFYKLAIPNA
jgi:Putative beta-barrel porin-2, OmpL-like. bbp2